MHTTVVDHPLAAEQLTLLRDAQTDRATFRRAVDALAGMLVYEATRALPVEPVEVRTPLTTTTGSRLVRPPLLVPVLRAGLGMAEAAIRLLPDAEMSFIGLTRDEATFQPHPYMAKLPEQLHGRPALLLDPMLATGGSLAFACRMVAERGAGELRVVCVLAAPEGLALLEATGLVHEVVCAAVDDHLDDRAFIVPGLGDAGDRLFGPA